MTAESYFICRQLQAVNQREAFGEINQYTRLLFELIELGEKQDVVFPDFRLWPHNLDDLRVFFNLLNLAVHLSLVWSKIALKC